MAVLAAVGACFASAAPTGVPGVDLVWRAAFAVGLVLVGARASRWVLVAVAAIATALAVGAAVPSLAAGLALGAGLAFATSTRHAPLWSAVVVAVLVQALLRFDHPHPFGATAAAAGLLATAVVVSGWRGTRSSVRRRRTWYAVAGTAALLLVSVAGTIGAALAANPLRQGVAAAREGLQSGRQADNRAASEAFSHASARLSTARDRLEAPWVTVARIVPVLSQHLRLLHDAASSGNELAIVGSKTASASDLNSLRVTDGTVDLAAVSALAEPLADAAGQAASARRQIDAATASPWLAGPVRQRIAKDRDRLAGAEQDARRAALAARFLPGLLGGNRARRYFLAVQTPSELRGSGGIIGNYAEVRADAGHVQVGDFGRVGDLDTNGVPPGQRTISGPADYLARYARFQPAAIWQNVTVSPDFPTVGQVIGELYPQSGGTHVDGVISVDPSALVRLLSVIGPVTVAPWPEPITADNAERILLFEQYNRLQGQDRTDFLGRVAKAVATKLTSGTLPPPADVARALAPAVAGHHLLLWSPDGGEESLFDGIGASGRLRPAGPSTDFLAVVNNNAGGNKLDWFLRRSYTYRSTVTEDGTLTATLDLTLRNDAPTSGLADYVLGTPGFENREATNRTFVSVYSPWFLEGATENGAPLTMESQVEDGLHVYSAFVDLPAGGGEVSFVLRLQGRATDAFAARPEVFRQPVVANDVVRTTFSAP